MPIQGVDTGCPNYINSIFCQDYQSSRLRMEWEKEVSHRIIILPIIIGHMN